MIFIYNEKAYDESLDEIQEPTHVVHLLYTYYLDKYDTFWTNIYGPTLQEAHSNYLISKL